MNKILLVEPSFRSSFPPLGLMRLSTYHKSIGDEVIFTRGCKEDIAKKKWDRLYISSLFTWTLPLTVKTINYYTRRGTAPEKIYVGGVAASLMPEYIKENSSCNIITGQVEKENQIPGLPRIDNIIPDYNLIDFCGYKYQPENAYFSRITKGCIRNCKFCAVPKLEPNYGVVCSWKDQIYKTNKKFGERKDIVFLDNNILGEENFPEIIENIRSLGFTLGSKYENKLRHVDFNQGIDVRLINKKNAELLSSIPIAPVRLAFDQIELEKVYSDSIKLLAEVGLHPFTNYILFNFKDKPVDFYKRLKINVELNNKLDIRISGFPMKYIPINDLNRKFIGDHWNWRYIRGIQCILQATHGVVSPSMTFFHAAFGNNFTEFKNIISMPDRYIIYRSEYKKNGKSDEWFDLFSKIRDKKKFYELLKILNSERNKIKAIEDYCPSSMRPIIDHYYPDGKVIR